MRAVIDERTCVGHGLCYTMAPQVYEDDEDGFGMARRAGEVPAEDEDAARTGAANCPERAISLL